MRRQATSSPDAAGGEAADQVPFDDNEEQHDGHDADESDKEEMRFVLYVRQSIALSGPLRDAITRGAITVRYLP